MTVTNCDPPPPYTATGNNAPGDAETNPTLVNVPASALDCTGYFAPGSCFGLQIGTVFDDLDSPIQGKTYQVKETLPVLNKNRDIQLPRYGLITTNNSGILNKVFNMLNRSGEVKTYVIEQLSIAECCVDEELIDMLGKEQRIRKMIENSSKKKVFFVYGTARGGGGGECKPKSPE